MKVASRFAVLMIVGLAVALWVGPNAVMGQPPGGRGFRGGRGGFFGGGGTTELVQQQEVQREIELTEDQQSELRELSETIRNEVRDEMRGMFERMHDLNDDERQVKFDEIRQRMEAINKDAETRMQAVLLPHQFDRLKQIDLQSRIQRGGAAALTEGELAETLGLTESQREQIQEKSEEVQKDLQEKINQLRLDARNQLLEVLTPEQRAKLESMTGAEFALPEPRFGGPGGAGGRGGRGGFGGRGGQGGRGAGNGGNGGNGGDGGGTQTDAITR